jgi:hypothetical protein
MGKRICKDKKKIRKKEKGEVKFECKKCGENSVKDKHLCKPKKL